MKYLFSIITIIIFSAFLTSCSGGGSDSSDTTPVSVTGTFIDAVVIGLNYTCTPSGASGTTNNNGGYTCNQGDDVTFSVEEITLGTVPAQNGMITPYTLFPTNTVAAINIARLLQSLDSDSDPNTITINATLAASLPPALQFTSTSFEANVENNTSITLIAITDAMHNLNEGITAAGGTVPLTAVIVPGSTSEIDVDTTIIITFSKSMNPSSALTSGTIGTSNKSWTTDVNTNDRLTLTPQASWTTGSQTLIVNTQDTEGNALELSLIYTVNPGIDADGDGYLANNDCNDTNADVNPGAVEIPDNGIDDNCNGVIDEIEVCDGIDNDGDGQIDEDLIAPACALQAGVCSGSVQQCGGAVGWLACDADVYAAHSNDYSTQDICDNLDNDCDAMTDEDGIAYCDDGYTCTTDQCNNGTCEHINDNTLCDDGNQCTINICDPLIGGCDANGCNLTYVAADTACDDGNPNTSGDVCDGTGICSGTPCSDQDSDGVCDNTEATNGTDPLDPDTDNDGLSDSEEMIQNTDALDADSDDDGLRDGEEINIYSLDPLDDDSDNDGLNDGLELGRTSAVASGTSDGTAAIAYSGTNLGIWNADTDSSTKTDPLDADSDNDGLCDGSSTVIGVCIGGEDRDGNGAVGINEPNPADADTDDDAKADGAEDLNGNGIVDGGETDPLVPNSSTTPIINGGISDGSDPDGQITFSGTTCTDADADGYCATISDCDDSNKDVNPGAAEICDGIDNDCSGSIPSNEIDDDGDRYIECHVESGVTSPFFDGGDDCDDTDPTIFPGNGC